MSANVDEYRAAHENFNRRDFEATIRNFADGFRYVDHARGITFNSPQEFKEQFLNGWATAFSDAEVTKPEYIDAGDTVVSRFTGRGTNDGPLGPFPATGRPMEVEFCEILRYDGNGKVVAGEIFYDQMSILTQLGHVEAPAAVPA
jgi:predicted ester cyclase